MRDVAPILCYNHGFQVLHPCASDAAESLFLLPQGQSMAGPNEKFRIVRDTVRDAGHSHGRGRFQWRLATIFLATTVAAIASAGLSREGFEGALGAVVLSWLGLIGLHLLVRGIGHRAYWTPDLGVGVVMIILAGYGMWSLMQSNIRPRSIKLVGLFEGVPRPESLITLLIGGTILYGLWRAAHPKWTVRIVANAEGVELIEGIAQAKIKTARAFFEREVLLTGHITIRAFRQSNGHLHVNVRGPIGSDMKQRIRNFLTTVM
jgi:hypothetical protein